MVGCLGQSRPARDADVVARTVAVVALAALAVIHVVDLPGPVSAAAGSRPGRGRPKPRRMTSQKS